MNNAIFSILILSVLLSATEVHAQEIESREGLLKLVQTREIILQEDEQPFDYASSLAVSAGKLFISSYNPPTVISYNIDGTQNGVIAAEGRGPHEFLMPSVVTLKEENQTDKDQGSGV